MRIWLLISILCGSALAGDGYALEESREINQRFSLADAATTTVEVDNIFGSITVVGDDGSDVRLEARETIHARDTRALERARAETRLASSSESGLLSLYADGPFRDWNRRSQRRPGYVVAYEIVLRVPREVAITLSTVNDGDISAEGVTGAFEVRNVNGSIDLRGLAAAGEATTVNGHVRASWIDNPRDDCRFKSVNGPIELEFRPALDADFELESFNGEAATDFSFERLPGRMEEDREYDGSRIFKLDEGVRIRVGRGGPTVQVETLNGDIELSGGRD